MSLESEALIVATRAEAKVDMQSDTLRDFIRRASDKLNSLEENVNSKFNLLRKENSEQHAQASREREHQHKELTDSINNIIVAVTLNKEEGKHYTDTEVGKVTSKMNKIIWWAVGVLGTGSIAGISADKLIGLI